MVWLGLMTKVAERSIDLHVDLGWLVVHRPYLVWKCHQNT